MLQNNFVKNVGAGLDQPDKIINYGSVLTDPNKNQRGGENEKR